MLPLFFKLNPLSFDAHKTANRVKLKCFAAITYPTFDVDRATAIRRAFLDCKHYKITGTENISPRPGKMKLRSELPNKYDIL